MQRDEAIPAIDTVTPAARSARSGWRAALAGLVVVAVLAAAVGIVATVGDGERSLRALPLVPGSSASEAGADAALYPAIRTELRLAGELPDLGEGGAVYRVVGATLDAADVAAMATALGIDAAPVATTDGWHVSDDDGALSASRAGSGPWYVWFGAGHVGEGGGSVDGEPGNARPDARDVLCADGASDDGCAALLEDLREREAATASGEEPADTPTGDEPVPVPLPEPTVDPPADLPSATEAERIARDVLGRMGALAGAEWEVTVSDGGTVGVALACPEGVATGCDLGETSFVTSRSVAFRRVIDGFAVAGLDWWVEIGDGGVVQSLSGALADLEAQGEYPLRSTRDVYDDLVSGGGWWGGDVRALGAETGDETGDAADGVADDAATGGGSDPSGGTDDDPGVIEPLPEPLPEPEPVIVTITAVERSLVLFGAFEDGADSSYLVPAYRFVGTYDDGNEYRAELPALDPANVAPPTEPTTPPATEPAPLPEPPPEPVPEPQPEPDAEPEPARLEVGVAVPYSLYTHCGAKTARFDGRLWISETFGDDALVSAPDGWGDPGDLGTLVLVDDDLAEYTASTGETLVFTPAPPDLAPDPCA